MKSRSGSCMGPTIFAALTIIGCCVSSMLCCQKRRVVQRKQLDEAVQNWEGEGGAVVGVEDDDEPVGARA